MKQTLLFIIFIGAVTSLFPNNIDNQFTVNLSGGSAICEGDCTEITVQINGGQAPYQLDLLLNNQSLAGITDIGNTSTFQVCFDSSFPIISVDNSPTIINVPAQEFPLTMDFFQALDANACQGTTNTPSTIISAAVPDFTAAIPRLSCDSLILPPIIPTGAANYFTEPNGNGIQMSAGDVITFLDTQLSSGDIFNTIYLYNPTATGPCPQAVIPFTVSQSPLHDVEKDIMQCAAYPLPEFSGPIVTAGAQYSNSINFEAGSLLSPGDLINQSQTIYLADTLTDLFSGGFCTFLETINIEIINSPFSGIDTTITICSSFSDQLNYLELLGNADTDGIFSHDPIVDFIITDPTSVDVEIIPPGTYEFIYTIERPGCMLTFSTLTLVVIDMPFAGIDSSISLCNPTMPLDFVSLLQVTDLSGVWTQISGSTPIDLANPAGVMLDNAALDNYQFVYEIPSSIDPLCSAVSATLDIEINSGANAGEDGTFIVCQGTVVDLPSLLGPSADTGGTFSGDGLLFIPNNEWNTGMILNPLPNYEILYIVNGGGNACSIDTAVIQITLTDSPTAGIPMSNPIEVCDGETINLGELLTGETEDGIYYVSPGFTQLVDEEFTIQSDDIQIAYIVNGIGACDPDTSFLNINSVERASVSFVVDQTDICVSENQDNCTLLTISNNREVLVDLEITDTLINQSTIYSKPPFGINAVNVCFGNTFGIQSNDTLFLGVNNTFLIELDTIIDDQFACTEGSLLTGSTILNFSRAFDVTFERSVCIGETTNINGTLFGSTTVLNLTTINGCDSIINVIIDTIPTIEGSFTRQLCVGDTARLFNQIFTENVDTTIVFPDETVNRCDSIVNISVAFSSVAIGTIDSTVCIGESINLFGEVFDENTQTGTVDFPPGGVTGCDSIINVSLSFFPIAQFDLIDTLCPGDFRRVGNDIYDENNTSGMTTLFGMSSNGCDSIVDVELTYNDIADFDLNMDLCEDEFIDVGSDRYDISNPMGRTTLFGESEMGCDSIVNVDLTFMFNITAPIDTTLCPGESIIVNGTTYFLASYGEQEILTASNGCDSIIDINIAGIFPTDTLINTSLCPGSQLEVGGMIFSETNPTGMLTLMNTEGCDSIIDIDLSFINPISTISTLPSCPGEDQFRLIVESLDGINLPAEITDGNTTVTIQTIPDTITFIDQSTMVSITDGICGLTEQVTFDIVDEIDISVTIDTLSNTNFMLSVDNAVDFESIIWTGDIEDCIQCDNISVNTADPVSITVEGITPDGCVFTEIIELMPIAEPGSARLYISNIIQLNKTDNNNIFFIQSDQQYDIDELLIYDRWGNIVFSNSNFQTNTVDNGWNGIINNSRAVPGVYVYRLQYQDPILGEIVRVGNFTLIY